MKIVTLLEYKITGALNGYGLKEIKDATAIFLHHARKTYLEQTRRKFNMIHNQRTQHK